MADSAQLTLADLTAAQSRVPVATWAALTPKQQAFVAVLAADPTTTYTAAARRAGSPRPKQSGSAWANDPKVKAALDHLRAAAQETAEDAFTFVTRRLRENDRKAFAANDVSASTGALALFAKVQGLLEKRVRLSVDNPEAALAQLKAMPKAERVAVLRELLGLE